MKKQTIWILTILMGITLLGLLFMQIFYMRNMVQMRYDQFDQTVIQSLHATTMRLHHDETRHYLEKDVDSIRNNAIYPQYLGDDGIRYTFTTNTGLRADLTIEGEPAEISNIQQPQQVIIAPEVEALPNFRNNDRFQLQKSLIDDVIIDIISQSNNRPILDRANPERLSSYLRNELDTLGLNLPFEFAIVNRAGTISYKTAGFDVAEVDPEDMFVHALFPRDTYGNQYFLQVYFPTKTDFVYSSMSFIITSIIFTVILLIVFVFTIITAFRQKKLTEMKNDFINNMTHEFKTPISSISLAGQMLDDPSVRKSPVMLNQISTVINDETKRMRFLVEKVLQMSLFEGKKATLKLDEIDANSEINTIVNTFKLKVEKYGGKITAKLDAMNAIIMVDRMHFTNVIFNLLDNAVKYRRDDEPLRITVSSQDINDEQLRIIVEDNGLGISRDDQKRIFDKFFRVSTGNRHDVKGFGLGLAYVRKMITELGGSIAVESQLGQGTRFIITLPLSKS